MFEQDRPVLSEGHHALVDAAERALVVVTVVRCSPVSPNEQLAIELLRVLRFRLEACREEKIPDEQRDRVLKTVRNAVMTIWAPGTQEWVAANPDIHWPSEAVRFFLCQFGQEDLERRLEGTGLVLSCPGFNINESIVGSARWVENQRAQSRRAFVDGLADRHGEFGDETIGPLADAVEGELQEKQGPGGDDPVGPEVFASGCAPEEVETAPNPGEDEGWLDTDFPDGTAGPAGPARIADVDKAHDAAKAEEDA